MASVYETARRNGSGASGLILHAMEQAGGHGKHRAPAVFADMIEVTYQYLRMLPAHVRAVAETGQPAPDDDEARVVFDRVRERYEGAEYQGLMRAAVLIVQLTETVHGRDRAVYDDKKNRVTTSPDLLGYIFENVHPDKAARGQYFTPWEVCRLMARTTVSDGRGLFQERVREAIRATPSAWRIVAMGQLLNGGRELRVPLRAVLPEAWEAFEPVKCYDPCCGSGRTLIAAAAEFPRWAVGSGAVQFYGQDIAHECYRMAQINVMIQGFRSAKVERDGLEVVLDSQDYVTFPALDGAEPEPVKPDVVELPPPAVGKHGQTLLFS